MQLKNFSVPGFAAIFAKHIRVLKMNLKSGIAGVILTAAAIFFTSGCRTETADGWFFTANGCALQVGYSTHADDKRNDDRILLCFGLTDGSEPLPVRGAACALLANSCGDAQGVMLAGIYNVCLLSPWVMLAPANIAFCGGNDDSVQLGAANIWVNLNGETQNQSWQFGICNISARTALQLGCVNIIDGQNYRSRAVFQLGLFNSGNQAAVQLGIVNRSNMTGLYAPNDQRSGALPFGIQIGLWNDNGKFYFPLVNLAFRQK